MADRPELDKLPPPPGGYCPEDLAPPPVRYIDDRRPYRRGDYARARLRRERRRR